MEKKIEDLKKQIEQWVDENSNPVSYTVLADIIKEEYGNDADDGILNKIIYELIKEGYDIETAESDETYPAEGDEPDKFIPADVNITQKTLNVYNLMERLEYDELNLKPAFQRKSGLWSDEQQSQLIESLMLKIPLPAFYFDASSEAKWIVIDGLQRLTAFNNYLVGEQDENSGSRKEKRKFVNLQYLSEFNGLTFDELPRQYIRRIKESSITAYTVEKGTPDEVVFNIFRRINTGGLQLSDQEIRHALYSGKGTELTVKLADSKEFLEATQYAVRPERMLDREYITRFLAFTELDYTTEYRGNIDNFLIKGLKCVNNYSEDKIEDIERNFKRIMVYIRDIFGRYAFRKYSKEGRRGRINKAIFELWSICFYNLPDVELDRIVERREEFRIRFQQLLQNPEFTAALGAGDSYSYRRRVSLAQEMIKEFLC